jgi:exonuclease III
MKHSEKLFNRYKEEIESWDWIGVKTDALTNCFFDEENDQVIASTFIGTVFALAPSGKYYTFWTTNAKTVPINVLAIT